LLNSHVVHFSYLLCRFNSQGTRSNRHAARSFLILKRRHDAGGLATEENRHMFEFLISAKIALGENGFQAW
ncbi:hypothetical protein M8C21_024266, partial [Ambrosia artemisiifolia]